MNFELLKEGVKGEVAGPAYLWREYFPESFKVFESKSQILEPLFCQGSGHCFENLQRPRLQNKIPRSTYQRLPQ
jgi:hypothetical protein